MALSFDHYAVNVTNIPEAVEWYRNMLQARVVFQNERRAVLRAGGVNIALVLSADHPAHVAWNVGLEPPPRFRKNAVFHLSDGSWTEPFNDCWGNALEWVYWPQSSQPGLVLPPNGRHEAAVNDARR
jgi:catechol 2,3-dioxygenase-like lactoylglutathione lyase family enzyme